MTDATTLLLKAATQFRYYERNHRAKNTPESLAKAEINADQASEIERYLSGQPDTLAALLTDVREFHTVFAPDWLPGDVPAPLTEQEAEIHAKWIGSEARELVDDTVAAIMAHAPAAKLVAHGGTTEDLPASQRVELMAKQADAFIDAIYFSTGGLVRLGLDPSPLWAIIHGQNMAKQHTDMLGGKYVVRREGDGKIVKPDGWVDPHAMLVAEITRQVGA